MIPYGYCECGCGRRTNIAHQTDTARGYVKGEPFRFVTGHSVLWTGPQYVENPETGCWVWQRCISGGYGRLPARGRTSYLAHRYFYEEHVGPIPDGMQLDHLCRNRACVNPDHLEPVTNLENQRRGSKPKLTVEDVRAIRASTEPYAQIAERFGIGTSNVCAVRLRRTWRDVA